MTLVAAVVLTVGTVWGVGSILLALVAGGMIRCREERDRRTGPPALLPSSR